MMDTTPPGAGTVRPPSRTPLSPTAAVLLAIWNFESGEPGKIAPGFTSQVGTWEVARDGDNKVLAQKAKNEDRVFNFVLVDERLYRDVELSPSDCYGKTRFADRIAKIAVD
jgi:hypothetical protein